MRRPASSSPSTLGDNELRVTSVATGTQMAEVLAENAVDLVLLDLRLAGEDGMQIARKLREEGAIPIIVVSGKLDEADRVMALELGADDYLTKPFSPRELLARVRAVLRRYETARELLPARDGKLRAYRFASWELNLRTRRLTSSEGKRVELSNHEFSLLQAFCSAPGRVLSREQLLDLTRLHSAGGVRPLDRRSDSQAPAQDRAQPQSAGDIRTQRGAGYLFDVRVEALH